jgi:hypothetical protein
MSRATAFIIHNGLAHLFLARRDLLEMDFEATEEQPLSLRFSTP